MNFITDWTKMIGRWIVYFACLPIILVVIASSFGGLIGISIYWYSFDKKNVSVAFAVALLFEALYLIIALVITNHYGI